MGITTIKIKAQPPISIREPNRVQKLSGAQLFIPDFDFDPTITSVATSATAAVVSPPTTRPAVTDTALPTSAPVVPRLETIAAFLSVVHPTVQAHPAMTTNHLPSQSRRLPLLPLPQSKTFFFFLILSICPCCLLRANFV